MDLAKEEKGIVEDKSGRISDDELIRIRKDKITKILKSDPYLSFFIILSVLSLFFSILTKIGFSYFINVFEPFTWFALFILSGVSAFLCYYKRDKLQFYPLLAFVAYLAVKIRTSNLAGLKDITTGTWTLGPDLDPFLFLRWAKYIVEHGSLMAIDTMRYVPLGYDTRGELILLPYMIAWFHKIAVYFGSESITHSAVLFPAFMFGLTVIAFFFMTRKIFLNSFGRNYAEIIGLIASFFLSVIPALLPRTIAGIPEKESAAFFFLFLTFCLFLYGWESKGKYSGFGFSTLAGLSTGAMALIWGGYNYIFSAIGVAIFLSFMFNKIDKKRLYYIVVWLAMSFILMNLYSTRYTPGAILNSSIILIPISTVIMSFIHLFILSRYKNKSVRKLDLPEPLIALILMIILTIITSTLFFGPSYVVDKFNDFKKPLTNPVTDRVGVTVAENRQPYFSEWESSFGPHVKEIALSFWLIMFGSVLLFYRLIRSFDKKDRIIFSGVYFILLISIIFSRYKQDHILNGASGLSDFVLLGGFVLFILCTGFYYYKYYRLDQKKLKNIDFGYLLLLSFFIIGVISAKGSVRTIMMLVPPGAVIISFLNAEIIKNSIKKDSNKLYAIMLLILVVIPTIFSGFAFYKGISSEAPYHVPSGYTHQWQKAMSWVRENTPKNAVFGHWWDYGYWVQSIGERATVLDGGNAVAYWNHFMGRHALTGSDNLEALEFLYAHKTTHFLIDSTDIGKYSAFSSIGSNVDLDRASFIPTFYKDPSQTQEKKNSTVSVYLGGIGLDEDIIYEENGSRIFLPSGQAGIGAILIEKNREGTIEQPVGVFVHQGSQYSIPFRYVYYNKELKDFGSGIESGIYIYPRFAPSGNSLQVDAEGAMLYLSKRTVKSHLARLYLYNEDNPNFKLAHSEDDLIVAQIKGQNPSFDYDIVDYGGFRGPIKIWEIDYPKDVELKEEYLETYYPPELLYGK